MAYDRHKQYLKKIEKDKLPSKEKIAFSENGDELTITMNQNGTTANMQNNEAAFEAWALVVKTAGYASVVLSENEHINEIDLDKQLHYNRFLYRVSRFEKAFDWFTISSELKKKCEDFEYKLSRDNLFVNAPTKVAKSDTKNPEATMERLLVLDEHREFLNHKLNLDIPKYYNQLSVGLFNGEKTSKAAIFPQGCAAIDVWGISGSTLHLIELKVGKNQGLGVLSEIFFYACFIYDMYCKKHLERKAPANFRGYPDLIKANIEKVVAHILTEQLHPLLEPALAELKHSKLVGIRFEGAKTLSKAEVKSK
jgi:hypothetical protein